MLTEKEKEWLERRKRHEKEYGSVYCPYCDQFIAERDEYIGNCYDDLYCPLTDHFLPDVAEFEARVACELTNPTGDYMPLCIPDDCDFHDKHNCRECRLMYARIAVEAEMDGSK